MSAFFHSSIKRMTSYNIYPNLSTKLSAPLEPQPYHLNIIQSKQQELLKLEETYKKKYEQYSKTLNRLVWLNACLSGLSVATRISIVVTLSTFIDLPVSILLGVVSLAGTSFYDVAMVLTKKYLKKLLKVVKFRLKSNIGNSHEWGFQVLQELHLKVISHSFTMGFTSSKGFSLITFEKNKLETQNIP